METQKKEMINKIRISADISSNDNPSNYDFGSMVKIKSGDDVVFDFLLLNGGNLIDTSQIQALTLEVLDIGCLNAPEPRSVKLLASKTLSADKIIALDSVDDFKTGKYNVSFAFSSQESNWGNGHKWIVLTGYSVDGSKTTFTQGWVETFARYSAEDEILPEVQSPFIRKEYADALYLNAQANLLDVSDVSEARSNLGVYSYGEVVDLLRQSEDNVLIEINSVSQDVQNNSANISSLAVAKANRGVLYFNKGTLTCSQIQDVPVSFSMCRRFAFTKAFWDSIDTSTKDFYFDGSFDGYKGASFCKGKSKKLGIGYGNGSGQWWTMIDLDETNSLMDGNVHSLVGIGANDELRVYVDNKLCARTSITSSSFTPERANQIVDISGLYFDIYNFNFDISDANAPYTLSDYQQGKPIPPLLQTTQPVIDWHNKNNNDLLTTHTEGQSGTLKLDCTDSGGSYPRIFKNGTFKVGYTYYIRLSGKVLFPSGQRGVLLRLHLPTSTAEITNNLTGEVETSTNSKHVFGQGDGSEFDRTIKFIPTETNTDSNSLFYFNQIENGSNSYINVSVRCDSALLSLDDVKSGVQVLDKSGTGNHANISGTVYASKENNPARCVDSASFSWAGTATTQKFANSDVAIPANSKVVAYAKANVGMSASFTCGSNSAVSKELSANTLTEIGSFLNASQGAFKVTPSSAITGKMDVYLTIEKF